MPSQLLDVKANRSERWGIILAGGDGKRLLSLTRMLTGDDRPKQFCALTGGKTLLDETRQRVARLVPENQTLLLLTQTHEKFYARELAETPPTQLLVQPYNHGTAPAIAFALMRLQAMDPDGTVAFFPSDHHFGNNEAFGDAIDLAFAQAEADRERVILLGISPEAPEESYGWIEPGASLAGPARNSVFQVKRFWEKPSRNVASRLMRRGCLWNSFVMVGRVRAFLNLLRQTLPSMLSSMAVACSAPAVSQQIDSLRVLYSSIPATNFSDDVLSANPAALSVLRADEMGWSDLGEPQRVHSVVKLQNAVKLQTAGELQNAVKLQNDLASQLARHWLPNAAVVETVPAAR
jgi:mannose-1-phosphate guanylyltransferase